MKFIDNLSKDVYKLFKHKGKITEEDLEAQALINEEYEESSEEEINPELGPEIPEESIDNGDDNKAENETEEKTSDETVEDVSDDAEIDWTIKEDEAVHELEETNLNETELVQDTTENTKEDEEQIEEQDDTLPETESSEEEIPEEPAEEVQVEEEISDDIVDAEETSAEESEEQIEEAEEETKEPVNRYEGLPEGTELITLTSLPESFEDLSKLPEFAMDTPKKTAIISILAFCIFDKSPDNSRKAFEYLLGSRVLCDSEWKIMMKPLMEDPSSVERYFNGFKDGNVYTLGIIEDAKRSTKEIATVYVVSGDIDKYGTIKLRHSVDGKWYLWEFNLF